MRTADASPVLAGQKIKWTLEQIEQTNQNRVRLDWLRFTVPLGAVCKRESSLVDLTELDLMDQRGRDLVRAATVVDADPYTSAHAVAAAGARQIAELLSCGIVAGPVEEKGMDYYSARATLVFAGETVGMVLAGGKSSNQAGTVHVNLFGSAMLHIPMLRLQEVQKYIQCENGWITRADLSVDVWTGHNVVDVERAYVAGEFDVRGKRPKDAVAGSWTSGHSRTFYVGSRGTGKLFRAYEKGDELFGPEANMEWLRYEVELRSNHRVIDLDILTRPADFFAGCYSFCQRVLVDIGVQVEGQRIPTLPEVADVTAEAAVTRVARWVRRTAMPAIIAVFDMGGDLLGDLIESERHRLPRRLAGIAPDVLLSSFQKVAAAFAPHPAQNLAGAC